jgi:hypothetical protein
MLKFNAQYYNTLFYNWAVVHLWIEKPYRLSNNKKHTTVYTSRGIYSLKCSTCNNFYIGQTGRDISTRFKEHHRYVRINNPTSAFAMHILNNNHQYNSIEEF